MATFMVFEQILVEVDAFEKMRSVKGAGSQISAAYHTEADV
jgi:hypothetical protein